MELTDIPDERSYAHQQQELLAQYGCPLILLSLHTFGPIDEHYAVFKRAFQEGLERVEAALTASGAKVLYRGVQATPPGLSYGVWVIDGSGKDLKRLCVELEDTDALSQLFDLDVVEPDGRKWDRSQLGCPPRKCILCGRKRHSCAAGNAHPTKVLQQTAQQILWDFFAQQDSKRLAALAAKALLYEVCTTPKPGLVDRNNNGSHKDMDLFTFLDSTAALLPYFEQAAALGQKTAGCPPKKPSAFFARSVSEESRPCFGPPPGSTLTRAPSSRWVQSAPEQDAFGRQQDFLRKALPSCVSVLPCAPRLSGRIWQPLLRKVRQQSDSSFTLTTVWMEFGGSCLGDFRR